MRVFDVLDPSIKLEGKFFLEAAAGCGKTFAIEHVISRLILEEEISLDECLIVTFTNAATLDLRARIQRNLDQIEKFLRTKEGELKLPYLEKQLSQEGALKKLQNALELVTIAPISTIHGFCYQFLKEQAFYSDLIEEDENGKVEDLLVDLLRTLPKSKYPPIWLLQFKNYFEPHRMTIVNAIKGHLSREAELSPYLTFEALFQKFRQLLNEKRTFDFLVTFEEVLPYLNGVLDKEGNCKFEKEKTVILDLFVQDDPHLASFEKLLSAQTFLEKLSSANIKKKAKIEGDKHLRFDAFFDWVQKLSKLVSLSLDKGNILLNLLGDARKEYDAWLIQHPLSEPDYLLKKLKSLCKEKKIQKLLQSRFKVIIIDEFQDTDPLQWEIFESAFFNHPNLKLLMCVGDPKQSIYGFRNADLQTYMKAKKQFGEEACYRLDKNFRSEKKLVDSLNFLLSKALSFDFFNFTESAFKIDYFDVDAHHEKLWDPVDCKAPCHFVIGEGKTQDEIEEKALFPFLIQEFFSLKKQGIHANEIAFLVKDRFQATRLKKQFSQHQIQLQSLKSESLSDSSAFDLVLALLKWLEDPKSKSEFKTLLFHPYVVEPSFLESQFIDEGWLTIFEKLYLELVQLDYKKNIKKTMAHTLDFFRIFEKILKRESEKEFDELVQVIEVVLILSTTLPYYSRLSFELQILKTRSADNEPILKKRVCANDESPHLLTLHASKGLEFDVVFAIGLYPRSKSQPDLKIIEENGKKILKPATQCQADLQSFVKDDMEKMRQFYVAITRAKKRLYIPIIVEDSKKEVEIGNLSPLELFLKKANHKTADYLKLHTLSLESNAAVDVVKSCKGCSLQMLNEIELVTTTENKQEEVKKTVVIPSPFKMKEDPMTSLSFSQIAKHQPISQVSFESSEAPRGKEFGTVIHELIEELIEKRLYNEPESAAFKSHIEKRLKWSSLETNSDEIIHYLKLVMTTPFLEGGICLSMLPYTALFPEMKFELRVTFEKELKGFIDLLVYYQGKYYLIDFKTNFLGSMPEDYEEKSLLKAIESAQYDLQAACYIKALKALLTKTHDDPFEELFGGMYFIFIRGLSFGNGVVKLLHQLTIEEELDHVIRL